MPDADRRYSVVTEKHSGGLWRPQLAVGGLGGTLRDRKPSLLFKLEQKSRPQHVRFSWISTQTADFGVAEVTLSSAPKTRGHSCARTTRPGGPLLRGLGWVWGVLWFATLTFGLTTLGVRHLEHVFFQSPVTFWKPAGFFKKICRVETKTFGS